MSVNIESLLALVVASSTAAYALYAISRSAVFASIKNRSYGFRSSHLPSHGYVDDDGEADEKALAKYTDRLPKFLAFLFIAIDLANSILGFFETTWPKLGLLNLLARVLTTVQILSLFIVTNPTQRYVIGLCIAISCVAGAITTAYRIYKTAAETNGSVDYASTADVLLLLLTAASTLSLPRRPNVCHDGRVIDGQYTVSAVQRYSFAWAGHLLKKAKIEERLEYDDLPSLHYKARTQFLLTRFFNLFNHTRWQSLWIKVFLAHKGLFLQQWILTVASSFALYAPQICMLNILKLLEERHQPSFTLASLWLWVAALGVSKVVQVVIESWLEWVNWAMLSVPVRSQLAAMIFQKSLRIKDIKGADSKEKEEEQPHVRLEGLSLDEEEQERLIVGETAVDGRIPDENAVEGEEEDPSAGRQQGIINLVGVDTVRISNFAAENNLFLSTVVNLVLALIILFNLLGWQGVCAGLVVPILLTPLNLWATRKYSDAQDSVMTIRDQRMALVGEALRGIRQIKFSAVEEQWKSMIIAIRKRELRQQWWVYILVSCLLCIWMAAPLLFSTVSLAVHAWQNGGVSPATAFTSLAIFATLEYALSVVPNLITEAIDANVSVQRIQKHLQRQERVPPQAVGEHVVFDHATVRWPSESACDDEDDVNGSFSLRELDLRFPKGELSVIYGKTGCGKSLLLSSILGESDVLEGSITTPATRAVSSDEWIDPSSVAYVAQIPWTENASIRDNILFGLPFVQARYKQVIWACALEPDIAIMPDGEFTEVGANGINLSGGQRWRITFARALYSRAGTLVLDDIFSAVDAHVGRHLLHHGLLGSLAAGRTRILATHHEELVLSATSYIVRLTQSNNCSYATTISQTPQNTIQENDDSTVSGAMADTVETDDPDSKTRAKPAKFVEDEVRERGQIKRQVYKAYMIAAGGLPFWSTALGVFILAQGALLGRAWLVKVWTEQDGNQQTSNLATLSRQQAHASHATRASNEDLYYYLGGYLLISLVATVLAGIKFVFFCHGSIEASRRLFISFTNTVLYAPLRWLDTVPNGRILNRFAADFNSVDSKLARDVSHFWESGLAFLGIVIAGMFVSVYMLFPSLVLGVICVYYTAYYLPGAREVKRLEATAQSPVFEHYGSTLTGLVTIRCFQKASEYQSRMHDKLDEYARSTWNLWLTQRWMSFRMGIIGGAFAFAVATVVAANANINAALAGFALSFSLQYSETVVEMIRRYSAMELDMNSTERIVEYTDMPTEDRSGAEPPKEWPSHGRIQVEGLEAAYAPGLPSVLHGISFEIEPGQRIGVVGRTGSGKSSFTLALFRFIEARSGRILIDGMDIAKISLQAVRSRLSIIPQDPVLFSGTIRTNLDVFNQYDDEALLESLRHVHLLDTPETGSETPDTNGKGHNTFKSLDSPVSEGGLSLSQGQRQLVCLARAIVARPKIMVLDEATSAVDMATDGLIQESIRKQFRGSTLIVIAHRLSTIADFDKILVMNNGHVVEFDEPRKLLEKPDGEFRRMLNESGEKEKLERLVYNAS